MVSEDQQATTWRSWAILIAAFLTIFSITYSQFVMSALGTTIMEELSLTPSQLSSVMNAPMLAGFCVALLAGGWGDRFGVRRVVAIGYILSVIGATLRLITDDYWTLFIAMFLMGSAANLITANSAKLIGAWFKRSEIGLAMGIFVAASTTSTMLAQITGARFGSVDNAYLFCAVFILLSGVYWVVIVQDRAAATASASPSGSAAATSTLKSLGVVLRNPHVWLVGLAAALYMGAQVGYTSFLPTALNVERGLDLATAGTVAALYSAGAFLGNVTVPGIATRKGIVKPVILVGAVLGMVTIYASWITSPGVLSYVLLVVAGFVIGSFVPLMLSAPTLLKSVDRRYVGSAGGLVSTLQMGGAYFLPTFVITRIAGTDYTFMFALAAVCCGLIAVVMALVPAYARRITSERTAS